MKIEFFEKDAPNTVKNFTDLAKKGYYDGVSFHRVIPNFMVQAGDGADVGYTINCEVTGDNQLHDRGVVSMAKRNAPNTGSTQFFICHNRPSTKHLDRVHTVFGKVVENIDIVDQIRQGDVMDKVVIVE